MLGLECSSIVDVLGIRCFFFLGLLDTYIRDSFLLAAIVFNLKGGSSRSDNLLIRPGELFFFLCSLSRVVDEGFVLISL